MDAFEKIPKNEDFYIRKSQAACAVDSVLLLLMLTDLFNDGQTEPEYYGTASERNRIVVWNIRLEMRE